MSLEVIKVKGKRALCRCTICGANSNDILSMVYNLSDIESGKANCRVCNFLDKVGRSDTEVWKKLILDEANNKRYYVGEVCSLSSKETANMGFFKVFPLGSKVGDGIIAGVVTKYKGRNSMGYRSFYMSGYKLAVKCRYCNCVTFSSNPKDFTCPVCSVQRNLTAQKEKKKMQEKSIGKEFVSFDIVKPPKKGGKMDRNLKRLEELNPKYKIINYSVKDGLQYNMVCKTCGSVQTVNRANTRIKECEICDSQKRNQVGVLKRDYINVTKLGLTCKAQDKDNFTCTLVCTECGRKHDNIPLYYFLLGRYCCDCEASSKIFSDLCCPNCYKPLSEYKMVDILKNDSNLICSCGENLTSFIEEELFAYNSRVSLRTKISMANEALKKSGNTKVKFTNQNLEVNPELVTEEKPLYCGNTDGKFYKRCYCQKHNIALILNEDEILSYDHEKCKDSRQGVVADINLSNLRLD